MSSVWYMGRGDRVVSPADWRREGVTDSTASTDFVWDVSNDWAMPEDQLTAQQLVLLASWADEFYVGAPDTPRQFPQDGGGGWLRIWPQGGGYIIEGSGVRPTDGLGWIMRGHNITPERDPRVPSGHTYIIEES